MLPSGLPELVGDEEELMRFLTQSSHFNSTTVKPAAFLPAPSSQETSVFRRAGHTFEELNTLGIKYAAVGRNIHGLAIIKAIDVRMSELEVLATEPPEKHAAIRNWPWLQNDPELQKAKQKDRALLLVSKASLHITHES